VDLACVMFDETGAAKETVYYGLMMGRKRTVTMMADDATGTDDALIEINLGTMDPVIKAMAFTVNTGMGFDLSGYARIHAVRISRRCMLTAAAAGVTATLRHCRTVFASRGHSHTGVLNVHTRACPPPCTLLTMTHVADAIRKMGCVRARSLEEVKFSLKSETGAAVADCSLSQAAAGTKAAVACIIFKDGEGWTVRYTMTPVLKACSWCAANPNPTQAQRGFEPRRIVHDDA